MLEFIGLPLVLISWIAGAYLVRTWRGTYAMSISEHAASAKEASKLFAFVLILGGGAFYAWLLLWFVPHLGLAPIFSVLLTATVALQFIAAIVPDKAGRQRIVHRLAAYTMAFLYLPLVYLIIVSDAISDAAKVVSAVCIAYMIFSILLGFFVPKARGYYLIFQSLYIVAFQVIILSAAYL